MNSCLLCIITNSLSQDLWDFLSAAFRKAKFILSTATLTDTALKDILGEIRTFYVASNSHLRCFRHQTERPGCPVQESSAAQHFHPGQPFLCLIITPEIAPRINILSLVAVSVKSLI